MGSPWHSLPPTSKRFPTKSLVDLYLGLGLLKGLKHIHALRGMGVAPKDYQVRSRYGPHTKISGRRKVWRLPMGPPQVKARVTCLEVSCTSGGPCL